MARSRRASYLRSNARARVLTVLQDAHGEWVDGRRLADAIIGGIRYSARIKELREARYNITSRPQSRSEFFEYRLAAESGKKSDYANYACRCGWAGAEPQATHTFFGVMCPKCGSTVQVVTA